MTDLPSIHYCVGVAMRDYEEFRLHENRERLVFYLRAKYPGVKFSHSSVERCQRKHWQQGRYLPTDTRDLMVWQAARNKGQDEYIAFAVGGGGQ